MKTTEIICRSFQFLAWIPYDFVERVWENDPLQTHLIEKYKGYCREDGYASFNAILKFFFCLSEPNQQKFALGVEKFIQEQKKKEQG